MSDGADIPESISETLVRELTEAREAVRSGDVKTARTHLETVERIVRLKLPETPTTELLAHGLVAVERTAADEPLVASEYLHSMIRLLDK